MTDKAISPLRRRLIEDMTASWACSPERWLRSTAVSSKR